MSVRRQIAAVLSLLAAPLAASAAPVTAGAVEAAMRSGAVTPPAVEATAPAPAPAPAAAADDTRRVRELDVGGVKYNETPAEAAPAQASGATAGEPARPTRDAVESGTGYTPSSYAAAAPTRG